MIVLVLGGGMIGGTIARDLAKDSGVEVILADADSAILEPQNRAPDLTTLVLDVTDSAALSAATGEVDLVVGAVPGHLGYRSIETVIKAGKPIVDISFMPEDPFTLNDLAIAQGVTAIVDAGVSPGLGNLIIGRFHEEYEEVDRFTCFVGGLPEERHWPFEYQSVFSPVDVIEEYTRLARMKSGGRIVVRPPLSDLELVDFPLVGTLEAFSSDGLRTLLTTLPIPYMKEKTLRYPGHADRIRMLLEVGFFAEDTVEVDGVMVSPRALTSKLLFDAWSPKGQGRDLTVMRVLIEGRLGGNYVKTTVDLYDAYDSATATTAMARTTGYTCAAVARLVLQGTYAEPGIHPLEHVGANKEAYHHVLEDLNAREVFLQIQQEVAAES